jgi:CHAT domain-containing protein/Tfp pilus assembly protein PilF
MNNSRRSRSSLLALAFILLMARPAQAVKFQGQAPAQTPTQKPQENSKQESGETASPASVSPELESIKKLILDGKYGEAEGRARTLLASVEASGGRESLQAAEVMDALVESLWRVGKAKTSEARELGERAVAIKEKALGPDDPETATSLTGLGNVFFQRADYKAAKPVLERALAIREKALGLDSVLVAKSLSNLGILYLDIGDYKTTRPLLERARAIEEKALGPDGPELAKTLNNLASLDRLTGHYADAKALEQRALTIWEKAYGPDHPLVALALSNLAVLDDVTGNYASARERFERALTIREKVYGSESSAVAETLHELASLHLEIGDYGAAKSLYERSIAGAEKAMGPEHPYLASFLGNYANLLMSMGDYAGARRNYERSLAIEEKVLGLENPQVATTLGNFANLLRSMGDYSEAKRLNERALAILEKALGPENPQVAVTLGNLANLLQSMGDYSEAKRLNERALAILEKTLGPEHPVVANSLGNLGIILQVTGDRVGARKLQERALRIKEKARGPEHPSVAVTLRNLAALDRDAHDYAAAKPLLERALAIDEKAYGPNHPLVASSLVALGRFLAMTNDYAGAKSVLVRALAIQQKALGADHPVVADTQAVLALALVETGEEPAGLRMALECEQIQSEHLRLALASLSEREALAYAQSKLYFLEVPVNLALQRAKKLPGASRAAWDVVARRRAVVLDEMAARHRSVAGAGNPEVAQLAENLSSARARLANLIVRGEGGNPPRNYQILLDQTRREREQAERALADKSAAFRRQQARNRLGFDEIAAALPPRSALVAFLRHDDLHLQDKGTKSGVLPSYAAFVLRQGESEPALVPLGEAAELEPLVARWRKEMAQEAAAPGVDSKRTEAESRRAGGELRSKVWDPIAARLGDAQQVFIVPDDALHLLNFAALPTRADRYLIETGPKIHYLSAERDLVPFEAPASGKGLLAVGAPAFDETRYFAALSVQPAPLRESAATLPAAAQGFRGMRSSCGDFKNMRFEDLPGSRREVEQVAGLWARRGPAPEASENVVSLTGSLASEAEFKRLAAGHRVLHLATHGFILGGDCAPSPASSANAVGEQVPTPTTGENPLRLSGLALAGANHRDAAGPDEEDGVLTAEEIAALDLSGVEWVVLSACDTGLGEVQRGEGVFGLRRAFQVAGARTLIMSLWPVDDRSTEHWMTALYRNRFLHGMSTADAVNQASLELLRQRRAKHLSTHPFYWAAFVAAGDWR